MMDRIAPTQRPMRRVVMSPAWHHLLFLHWEVAPEQLQPLLPAGLEIDLYGGKAYVGLIPFTMTGVRPAWAPPSRLYSDFRETNVRTYVHAQGRNPGVWFFSLDAANALAVCGARWWFKLPYFYARMNLAVRDDEIEYSSQRICPGPTPAGCAVRYAPTGSPAPAAPGTLEHFLVERYILYSWARGRLYSGRVHHAPYSLQPASVYSLTENLVAAADITRPDEAPISHYARGVQTEIFALQRVRSAIN